MRKLYIVVYLLLLQATVSLAENIRNFEVNITLESSGEFAVSETILYDFEEEQGRHGIYRDIPNHAKTRGEKFDVGLHDFHVTLDGKPVTWRKSRHYTNSSERVVRLKIGDPHRTVAGRHTYTITYRCINGILPSDNNASQDWLYVNAIGSGWTVPIHYAEVNIFFPPDLDQNSVDVHSMKLQDEFRWITSQHLQFEAFDLTPRESFSVKTSFPRGILAQSGADKIAYVKKQAAKREARRLAAKKERERRRVLQERKKLGITVLSWVIFAVMAVILGVKSGAVSFFGRRRAVVVRYEPPREMSVLQAGLLLDKFADSNDYSAAILELASLGYLTIEEQDGKTTLKKGKGSGKLHKEQKQFLKALFDNDSEFVVGSESLSRRRTLSKRVAEINDLLYSWVRLDGYAVDNFKEARKSAKYILIAIVAPLAALAIFAVTQQLRYDHDIWSILIHSALAFAPGVIAAFRARSFRKTIIVTLIGIGGWALYMKGALLLTAAIESAYFLVYYRVAPLDLLLSPMSAAWFMVIVAIRFYRKRGQLTPKGVDSVNYLMGLEQFITHVKEDEIERRLKDNPHYVEKMLPYAMLFGQIDHWLEFYDMFELPSPAWSSGSLYAVSTISSTLVSDISVRKRTNYRSSGSSYRSSSYSGYSSSSSSSGISSSSSSSGSSGVGGGGGGSW